MCRRRLHLLWFYGVENPGSQAPAWEPISSKLGFVALPTVFKHLEFIGDSAKQSFGDMRCEAGASQREPLHRSQSR